MIHLAEFQLKAMASLISSVEDGEKEVIFKSPTGSGKTVVLTHFMDEFSKGNFGNVFIWLTPGKGNLEEQSKLKMDYYIHNSSTKLLSDVMNDGFRENDFCFINWEKLTKKGNNALKETEKVNFKDHITKSHNEGLEFIVIVDESHQNDTLKATDIINLFKPKKIIRTSATPKNYSGTKIIEVSEAEVVEEGLIKKLLVINENFGRELEVNSPVEYLLTKALDKQNQLKKSFTEKKSDVNPLIIVQLPNDNDFLQDEVERFLSTKEVKYDNGLLAVWLSDRKENLEEIEEVNAKPIVILIKQAIATGWDCPRAHILVKLRSNTSETFEIQTIGRIRRMPELKHYEEDLLDSCYLYTFDEKFTEGVKLHMGKGALDAIKLNLKSDHKNIKFITEYKSDVTVSNDAAQSLDTMINFYEKKYDVKNNSINNKDILRKNEYIFSNMIIKHTITGKIDSLTKEEFESLERINLHEPLNTHKHGREYHNRVGKLGVKLGLPYEQMNTIIRRLFDKNVRYDKKILRLETKEVYAFIINNFNKLKEDFRLAMSDNGIQQSLKLGITEKEISIPQELLFTYDGENKVQRIYESNVYEGYLSSAEVRSDSEKSFEKFCNENEKIEWIYKNGDKGSEFLSIVYQDNFGKQRSFYPDYVLSLRGEIWIIETKGGFSRSGSSEDIDIYSSKKFGILESYLKKHNLKGGFVRKDKSNNELFICMNNYTDNIKDDAWCLLEDVLS